MPTYVLTVEAPADTAEADAVRDELRLPAGIVIDQVNIHVPVGNQATAPFRLEVNGAPWLPTPRGDGSETAFRLDDVAYQDVLAASVHLRRTTRLALVAWNEDTVNDHTVRVVVVARYEHEVPSDELSRVPEA